MNEDPPCSGSNHPSSATDLISAVTSVLSPGVCFVGQSGLPPTLDKSSRLKALSLKKRAAEDPTEDKQDHPTAQAAAAAAAETQVTSQGIPQGGEEIQAQVPSKIIVFYYN